ncbi:MULTISPECIES: flagellar hook capping FlgD N-terminal domain-containing protein [Arcobacteraceae]|uniref:Basal-body rod modification protein FlgD n=1 Tax=Poseidonibacter parvus TaxID=1850254 RepID=A0A1P8KPG3_9BACT|nr:MULTISPECIES: flagellar hook capping FlgD N-terminal domain-containing protein [Arcobacteraceae]APW66401.1 flagellar biosynthesis protein FlgD [Poseidonibacter parvus]
MATDIAVSSSTGLDGNSYTTSVSNDELTNDDFLTLMITELKLQDPTSPTDSAQMLQTQMQMSTISTNQEMVTAMQSLQQSFSQTALTNASNVIGKNIEDGNISDTGINKAYTVTSVESVDGVVQVRAQEILYLESKIKLTDPDDSSNDILLDYNTSGEIIDANGDKTGYKVALNSPGDPIVQDDSLVILDSSNEIVSDHNYALAGLSSTVYSDEFTDIPFSQITKIF